MCTLASLAHVLGCGLAGLVADCREVEGHAFDVGEEAGDGCGDRLECDGSVTTWAGDRFRAVSAFIARVPARAKRVLMVEE